MSFSPRVLANVMNLSVESNDLQLISSDGRDASKYTDYVRAVVSAAFLG